MYIINTALFSSSFVCVRTSFKGIVCPLVLKVHNVLDLVHPKECITLWSSQIQFFPFIGALSFSDYEIEFKHSGSKYLLCFQNVVQAAVNQPINFCLETLSIIPFTVNTQGFVRKFFMRYI